MLVCAFVVRVLKDICCFCQIQWAHLWEDFAGLPVIVEKGLVFKLKPADRKLKFLGKSSEKELVVHLHNPEVCTVTHYNKENLHVLLIS